MDIDLRSRVRGLFGKSPAPGEIDQVLAGWRAQQRPGKLGSPVKRELLHPMKGWVTDSADRNPNDLDPQWKVRHAAHDRTRTR